MNDIFGLREHQMDAVSQIEEYWIQNIKSICYQGATASGKTRIISTIIGNHRLSNKYIYLIAHRRNLVNQLSNEMIEAGIRHGITAAGYPRINYKVQVCSLQTLVRRLDSLPEAEIIIIDECHHIKSKTYMKIIQAWQSALILGVTATPARLDGKPLSDVFQTLIIGPPVSKLIKDGYLSDYKYYAPVETISFDDVPIRAGEFVTSELIDKVDNKEIIGSAIDHYKKYADHKPAIVSCVSIAHAEHVAKEFYDAGYKAKAIHSKLPQTEIEESIKGLKNGSVELLMQCELLGEGIDIPGATVLIWLRPTMSLTVFLQHIGRILRWRKNKIAIILDHVSNYTRHGMPDDERQWSLLGKSNLGTVNYKRCPECIRPVAKHIRICPYCDYEWKQTEREQKIPEEKEGKLVQITSGDREVRVTIDWKTLVEVVRDAVTLKEAIKKAVMFGKTHKQAWWIWNKILMRGKGEI